LSECVGSGKKRSAEEARVSASETSSKAIKTLPAESPKKQTPVTKNPFKKEEEQKEEVPQSDQ